ncbi:MAG TPA: AMP-binding protein, partial [Thermoplasmata archaeon]|nr:AMP-binding protein [Thermoplasmata archaeon]
MPEPTRSRPWLAKYPDGIPADLEVPDISLYGLIAASAEKYADRTALIYYGSRWTYRKFWDQVGRLAGAFAREGFRKGDGIALYLPNCPAYPIAYFAALRLGLVVVQVSPLYIEQDLERLLRDSTPKAIVALDIHYPNLEKVAHRWRLPVIFLARLKDFYPIPQRWFVNSVLHKKGLSTRVPTEPHIRRWKSALRNSESPPPVPVDSSRDVAVMQYTGGTTGIPKAAMLTHRNLVANVLQAHLWLGENVTTPQVYLGVVPYFHVYGMTAAMNQPLYEGASIVLETRPDVDEILKLIDRYHPTYFHGVPALYNAINQHPHRDEYDLKSIRICVSGSAPLPMEVARTFEKVTGGNLVEGYGLSETSPVTHVNPVKGERRPGSVGLPLSGTDQKVVDIDSGTRELPTGEVGELCVRGPQVMLGYAHQP